MKSIVYPVFAFTLLVLVYGCRQGSPVTALDSNDSIMVKLNDFALFGLSTDLSVLSENQRTMIPILVEAAQIMDDIFWVEAFGDKDAFIDSLEKTLRCV